MIIRKQLEGNYTRIPNEFLQDESISDKARGTLARLLSRPNSWSVNVNHLVKTGKDGHTALRSSLTELEGAGYLHKEVTRGKGGRITGTRYLIFDHRVSQRKRNNSEIAAEFEVLKEIEGRRAAVRQGEAGSKNLDTHKNGDSLVVENFPPLTDQNSNGKARDAAAEKLNAGWSGKTAEPQIMDTHVNNDDRMRKTHMREPEGVITNKGINNPKGVTTTTPGQADEQTPVIESPTTPPSSYPATEDINFLLDLIPEQHRQPPVIALVNQSAKKYTVLELEEAITYATANVRGGALQFRAYLDKTLKCKWAAGYLETTAATTEESILAKYGMVSSPGSFAGGIPAGKYPNGTVTGSKRSDSNLMACMAFMNSEKGEV